MWAQEHHALGEGLRLRLVRDDRGQRAPAHGDVLAISRRRHALASMGRAARSRRSGATVERIGTQWPRRAPAIDQAKAQLASTEAADRADLESARSKSLASRDVARSRRSGNRAGQHAQTAAAVKGARPPVRQPRRTSRALRQHEEAAPTLKELETKRSPESARDLSSRHPGALWNGVIGNPRCKWATTCSRHRLGASCARCRLHRCELQETHVASLKPGHLPHRGRCARRCPYRRTVGERPHRPPALVFSLLPRPITRPATSPRSCQRVDGGASRCR